MGRENNTFYALPSEMLPKKSVKKDEKNNGKSKQTVSPLRQDITYIKDSVLLAYNMLAFTSDGAAALVAHTDGRLRLWQTIPLKISTENEELIIKNVRHLIIPPKDQRAFVIAYDSVSKGLTAFVVAIPSLELLYRFPLPNFLDMAFSKDGMDFFVLQENNFITRRSIVDGTITANYRIPNYDETHTYYTRIKRIAIGVVPEKLLLFDIGYAEELSMIKKGIHINMYAFDFEQQKIAEPLSLYHSPHVTEVLPQHFTALTLSPDGIQVFVALRKKLLSFNLLTHVKKESNIGDIVEELRFDSKGDFLLSTGGGTSTMWAVLEKEPIPARVIRRMASRVASLAFTPNNKYLVGATKMDNRLVYFQADAVTHILDAPARFVLYCAKKHTQLDMMKQYQARNKVSGKTPASADTSQKEQQMKRLFNKNVQYYARAVFNIASDYLHTAEKPEKGASVMYLHTDGFDPIEIKISPSDVKKKQEALAKGWYKWNDMEFGFVKEQLFIKKADLYINGVYYAYNIAQNKKQPNAVWVPHFEGFNLQEQVE